MTPLHPPLEWQYSRTRHAHDSVGRFDHEYLVQDCRQRGFFHLPEDGYDLLVDGKQKAHAFTVKEMKALAGALNQKAAK